MLEARSSVSSTDGWYFGMHGSRLFTKETCGFSCMNKSGFAV
jgi:hypothetical protein